jgi:hypothetical protein
MTYHGDPPLARVVEVVAGSAPLWIYGTTTDVGCKVKNLDFTREDRYAILAS